jgi:hypothetical protein
VDHHAGDDERVVVLNLNVVDGGGAAEELYPDDADGMRMGRSI